MKNLLLSAALILASTSYVNAASTNPKCEQCKHAKSHEITELVNNAMMDHESAAEAICSHECK